MNSSQGMTFVFAMAAVAVLAIAYALARKRRSQRLRERFGPEYDQVVRHEGNVRKAEDVLAFREKRRRKFGIRGLLRADRASFLQRWNYIQGRFVEDPNDAVIQAEGLIGDIMQARGYFLGGFEQRAADISADHPIVIGSYRAAHEITERQSRGQASTEDLRRAMVHYRALLEELIEDHPHKRSA